MTYRRDPFREGIGGFGCLTIAVLGALFILADLAIIAATVWVIVKVLQWTGVL